MTGQDKHERQTLQYKLMCRVKHNYTIYNVKELNMFDIDRLLFYKGYLIIPSASVGANCYLCSTKQFEL